MLRWTLFWFVAALGVIPAAPAHGATGTFSDTTAAHFAAGNPGSDTYVAETGDGEVLLSPALGAEFYGSSLPPGWSATATQSGGGATVQAGALAADGARVVSDSQVGPGRALEFRATLSATPDQSVGFSDMSVPGSERWARFTTLAGGDLYASTNVGNGLAVDTLIPGTVLGTTHRYRIDWNLAGVDFYVDGALAATHSAAPLLDMHALVADEQLDGTGVIVDWLRVSPYAGAGTFDSRIFDAGRAVDWESLSWNSATPAATALTLSVRTGDTPTPDGTWSGFDPVSTSGGSVGRTSRFVQYRAELTSTDSGVTPSLDDVTIDYSDTTAPTVTVDAVSDSLLGPTDSSTDLTWHATEDGSYTVRVGGTDCATGTAVGSGSYTGAPATRTTSVNAADLSEGANTIRVCVTDEASNEGSQTATVTKDTTAPTVTIDAVSDYLLGPTDSSTDVTWRASENGSYTVRIGTGGWTIPGTDCATGAVSGGGAYSAAPSQRTTGVNASLLVDGITPISVCVVDAAGNQGSLAVWVVKDVAAPIIAIAAVSDAALGAGDAGTEVTWQSNESGAFSMRAGGTSCTTGTAVATGSYSGWDRRQTSTVNAAQLAEGSNTVRICVTDAWGNSGTTTTTVVKDTVAPTVTIDGASAALLGPGDSSTSVTWHATEDGSYTVRVGGTDCATGTAVASGSYTGAPATRTTTVMAAQLAEGTNTIRACISDSAANEGSNATSVVKDTTAPAVVIDAVSDALVYSTDTGTDVTWHADGDGPFSVRVGGTGCATGTAVASGSYTGAPATRTTTVTAAQLAEGSNTIRVCVTDTAGNQGAQTTTVVKDSTRATRSFTPEADARVEEANPDLNFGASTTLRVEAGSALDMESYLRFQVSGIGSVEEARLRLWVTNGTANGPAAYKTDWAGAESAITWNNRTARTSGATDDKGAIAVGAYVDYNLTPLVAGNGTHSFVLAGTSSDSLQVSSREAGTVSQRPELIITSVNQSGPDTQAPTAPTGLTAAASSSTLVNLTWNGSTDNVGVTGYRIFRGGNLLTTVGNVTSYVDSTVQASTSYQYQVRAVDAAGNVSNASNTASVTTPAPSPDPIIMAAGDQACDPTASSFNNGIGTTTSCRQKYTSDLLVNQPGLSAVLVPGDIQYECGGYQAFLQSYDPTWGRVKSITYPVPGNHEYQTTGGMDCDATGSAQGYFTYFGARAGDPTKGYYSFNLGSWHIVGLNSNCAIVSCAATSAQANWLRQDLAANPRTCTLAFWHHPRFTSGTNSPGSSSVKPLFQVLYDNKVDVGLTGHDHDYERFARKDPEGALDDARGVRQFVVGTGGKSFHNWGAVQPGSEARQNDTFGVLKMTLRSASYDWQFVPEAGRTYTDSGSTPCSV